jgi:hypothetical protein
MKRIAALVLLAACSSSSNPSYPTGPAVYRLRIVSGNNQSGPCSQIINGTLVAAAPLPLPLLVEVDDASGNPVNGVNISWRGVALALGDQQSGFRGPGQAGVLAVPLVTGPQFILAAVNDSTSVANAVQFTITGQ